MSTDITDDCNICAFPFNKRRKPVTCPKCQYVICKDCFQRYSIDHITVEYMGTTCMNCKEPLDFEFISENTTKDFVNNKWREARKEVLVGIEISKLPATQESAQQYNIRLQRIEDTKTEVANSIDLAKTVLEIPEDKSLNEYLEYVKTKIVSYRKKRDNREYSRDKRKEYREKVIKYTEKRKELVKIIRLNKTQNQEILYLQRDLEQYENLMTQFDEDVVGHVDHVNHKESTERRSFIMPCPFDKCNGFLSSGYKCGLCNKKICPTCHVKLDDSKDEHVCQKEAVDTVKMINSETKPCPKCGARISKINGCDQMWCICCKTAFSWNTGMVVVGERIHNPEYFRWMREREIPIPRAEDQIDCNERPSVNLFHAIRRQFSPDEYTLALNLIQKMEHFSAMIIQNQTSNRDLRVAFLTNRITKEKMKISILKRERFSMKTRFINGIYQLIVDVLTDILRKIRDTPSNFTSLYVEAINLCNYSNEQFSTFQKKHNLKTPRYRTDVINLFEFIYIAS